MSPLLSNNPSAFDVMQAQNKQNDAECSEDKEVKREGHDMLAVDRPVEDVDTVGYR